MRWRLLIAILLAFAAPQKAFAIDEPIAMKPAIMRFLGAFAGERPEVAFKSCREFQNRITDCDYHISFSQWTLGRLSILLGRSAQIEGAVYTGMCEYGGERDGSPVVEAIVAIGDHNVQAARSVLDRLRKLTYAQGQIHGKATIDGMHFTLNVGGRECSLFAVREERPTPSKVPT